MKLALTDKGVVKLTVAVFLGITLAEILIILPTPFWYLTPVSTILNIVLTYFWRKDFLKDTVKEAKV
jgi:hypothetical protein